MADRNYQLQGSYTRYYDGYVGGYNSDFGPSKRRNFATIESAIKAAKKELRRNEFPKVMRREEKKDERGRVIESHNYDENGRELSWSKDKPQFWHVDAMRIVDRETQKVLWEA